MSHYLLCGRWVVMMKPEWHEKPSRSIHWGRMSHKRVGNLTIIGSDNGLAPTRRQVIIWTIAGLLLIGPLVPNFSEISVEIFIFIQENAFENNVCEMAFILSRPQCVKGDIGHCDFKMSSWDNRLLCANLLRLRVLAADLQMLVYV